MFLFLFLNISKMFTWTTSVSTQEYVPRFLYINFTVDASTLRDMTYM